MGNVGNAGGGGEAAAPQPDPQATGAEDQAANPENPNNLPDGPGYDPSQPSTYVNEDAKEAAKSAAAEKKAAK